MNSKGSIGLGSLVYEIVLEGIKRRIKYEDFIRVIIRAEGYNITYLDPMQNQLANKVTNLIKLIMNYQCYLWNITRST